MNEQLSLPEIEPEIEQQPALTDWQYGPPPMTGWWDTRFARHAHLQHLPRVRRLYNQAGQWSAAVLVGEDEDHDIPAILSEGVCTQPDIMWRGLVERPAGGYRIPVTLVEAYWNAHAPQGEQDDHVD